MGEGRRFKGFLTTVLLCTSVFVIAPPAAVAEREVPECPLTTGCYPEKPPPPDDPDGCNPSCISDPTRPKVFIEGLVKDPYGAPIEDAWVYWDYGIVETNALGQFQIETWADKPVTLTATKDIFTWKSKYIDDPLIAAVANGIDYQLYYLNGPYVSPQAFKNDPPKTLDFTVYTTAPPTRSRVLMEVHRGEVLSFTQDPGYSNSDGWTRWTATYRVPAWSGDGIYWFDSCVLDSLATGDCSEPEGIVLSRMNPWLPSFMRSYVIDSVAPVLNSPSPAPSTNTLDLTPEISVVASDSLSGIDLASSSLVLDGTEVSSGALTYRPASNLSLGVHTATATATDLAGNTAQYVWSFNVVELSSTMTSISVTSTTSSVDLDGDPLTRPEQVVVEHVGMHVDEFDLRLSSSALTDGAGEIDSTFVHAGLMATFVNDIQEVTVPLDPESFTIGHQIAVLEPSSLEIGGRLPVSSTEIAVSVPVPPETEFTVTSDSTVTVWADEIIATATAHSSTHDQLLPLDIGEDCTTLNVCTVTGTAACDLSKAGDEATYSCSVTYPRVRIRSTYPSRLVDTYVLGLTDPYYNNNEELQRSTTLQKYPSPNPAAPTATVDDCSVSCRNVIEDGNANARLTAYWASGPLFRSYQHSYYFEISDSSGLLNVVLWQASDVQIGSSADLDASASCRETRLRNFSNHAHAEGGLSTSASVTTTGSFDDAVPDLLDVGPLVGEAGYRIGGTGVNHNVNLEPLQRNDRLKGDFGSSIPNEGVSGENSWAPSDGTSDGHDVRKEPAEIMTGIEFLPTSGSEGYALRSSVMFVFEYAATDACNG